MSEIDDIFASKKKGKGLATVIDSTSEKQEQSTSQKKKKKKSKSKTEPAPSDQETKPEKTTSKKRPLPETIVDPSQAITSSSKRHKSANPDSKSTKKVKVTKEDDERFKDSRGTSNRRTTEEGWAIYKEDELGISNTGGDTPLCPFDCECCF